jgi:hypothetical protein
LREVYRIVRSDSMETDPSGDPPMAWPRPQARPLTKCPNPIPTHFISSHTRSLATQDTPPTEEELTNMTSDEHTWLAHERNLLPNPPQ